ncbi:ROK family transcriptional regulator [Desulfosediminicola flagellatus]|uniref:ROK family transcriptional regulator n=1 Tax=Desulfosediminicola flagellatus TaxID=2569541 RepID=UPI00142EC666|nr:ROK family transcriptional regulator [Desulfosediminicola flagellatus]
MPMPVRDLMRAINRAKVIEIIRTSGLISRVDLAASSGLSKASVTGVTSDLIKEGLIIEKKSGEYEGGRRPMLLSLNPDGAYVIGVNLSISEISVVIMNLAADILATANQPLKEQCYSVEEITDLMIKTVQSCMWDGSFSKDKISGVGIAVPGPVYGNSGVIRFLPNYGWENVNLKDHIEEKLGLPCYIDNSSNTLAAAERWYGEGKGVDNFLVVTLLNGVGLGIVINGHLYRGAAGIAGEFGHTTFAKNGPLCRCGKNGCIESYAGMISLLRDAKIAAKAGKWQAKNPENITFDDLIEELKNDTPVIHEIFSEAGKVLGQGISNLVALFNPSRIIVTGTAVRAGEYLIQPLKDSLADHTANMCGPVEDLIFVQEWSDKQWARGAGSLVLQELYKSPVSMLPIGQHVG